MNPGLVEFLDNCRAAFRYLVDELGYREEELPARRNLNPFQVRYVNATTRIVVEGINWGFCTQLLIGPRHGEPVGFGHLLHLRDPHREQRHAHARGQAEQLSVLAEALRFCASDVLAGDLRILPEVRREQRRAEAAARKIAAR